MLQYEYARSALKLGLKLEQQLGIDPYKFGMIGSTDSHTSLATADEDNFFGKAPVAEPSPDRAVHPFMESLDGKVRIMGWEMVASGYAAVWATENTRAAIFDALMRKEVYATTGPRMVVRFFGGFNFQPHDAQVPDLAAIGYAKGVPMGGDLSNAPQGRTPSFLIAAMRDPIGANLDRIQIVKGWEDAKGDLQEKVYDVAWSDPQARKPGVDGKLPPVGNTVNVPDASYTNSIGTPELFTVWSDPDFDPTLRAFYYARVIDIPTPRWTAYDAKHFGVAMPSEAPHDDPGTSLHFADLVYAQGVRLMLRWLLREPLVHFLLVGGLLFSIFSYGGSAGLADRKIVVTTADIERLSQQFLRTWNRPPSAEELQSQIDSYIREEVLYRTALSLGLDKDDFIVRRRLRQKMEFLVQGALSEPPESDLRAFFHAHETSFLTEPMVSFRQVLVSDSRGSGAERDARVLLTKLIAARSDDLEAGDPSLLPQHLESAALSRVNDQFGPDFAQSLTAVKLGQWAGPLRSAYGYHLVFVTAMDPAHVPRFEDVRAAVERQWFAENRTATLDAQYRKLLAGFQVQIDHSAESGPQPWDACFFSPCWVRCWRLTPPARTRLGQAISI
jgi:hypothetical protein